MNVSTDTWFHHSMTEVEHHLIITWTYAIGLSEWSHCGVKDFFYFQYWLEKWVNNCCCCRFCFCGTAEHGQSNNLFLLQQKTTLDKTLLIFMKYFFEGEGHNYLNLVIIYNFTISCSLLWLRCNYTITLIRHHFSSERTHKMCLHFD